MKIIKYVLALLFLNFSAYAFEIPELTGKVVDKANVISNAWKVKIIEKISIIEKLENNPQIAVLTVPTLNGEDVNKAAIDVANKWKLGQKNKDNGILIFIAVNERRIRIEVGYGFEGKFTDGKALDAIQQMKPHLVKGKEDFGQAVFKAIEFIEPIITSSSEIKETHNNSVPFIIKAIVILPFFIIFGIVISTFYSIRKSQKNKINSSFKGYATSAASTRSEDGGGDVGSTSAIVSSAILSSVLSEQSSSFTSSSSNTDSSYSSSDSSYSGGGGDFGGGGSSDSF